MPLIVTNGAKCRQILFDVFTAAGVMRDVMQLQMSRVRGIPFIV